MEEQVRNVKMRWVVEPKYIEQIKQETNPILTTAGIALFTEVDTKVDPNTDCDIVINCLPGVEQISVSEEFLSYLTDSQNSKRLNRTLRAIKGRLERLGVLELFVNEVRRIYAIGIERFPDDCVLLKLYYAIIDGYKHIDCQSILYLQECAEHFERKRDDDSAGLVNYLLAIHEDDESTRIKLFRKSIGFFELGRLNDIDTFSGHIYQFEHAMCLIEYADELNNRQRRIREHFGKEDPYENKQYNTAYAKAIAVMKAFVTFEIQDLKGHQKQQYIRDAVNYIRNNVCSFEKRLSSSEFASELCGILQGHTEGSIKSIESNFGGIC